MIDRIARAASDAFSTYGRLSGRRKGELLRAIAARLEANADATIETANRETSLGLPRLKSELARTCNQIRMFATLVEEGSWVDARIDPALPDRQPLPRPDLRRMLIPLGPVVVFGSPYITPIFWRIWLMNTRQVRLLLMVGVRMRMAWLIMRACRPTLVSPISLS